MRRGSAVLGGLALAASLMLGGCSGAPAGPGAPLPSAPARTSPSSSTSSTSSTAPVLAPAGDTAQSHPVDGISCQTSEQLLFHIHAHLAVFVDGQGRLVPYGIGIGMPWRLERTVDGLFVVGGSCFSWLHTHDESGIVHIESPVRRIFTLGNFFDIWGQPLGPAQVGPARGAVHAFVNGQPYTADPRTVPLSADNVIQLDVGSPVPPPHPFSFPPGL